MSQAPQSITRSGRRILGYFAGSVALLLTTWLILRPGGEPPAEPAPEPVAAAASVEVPVESFDASRRAFADFDADEYRIASAAASLPADVVEARLRARAERPPPPPPDPVNMAANDAFLAAYPVATAELADGLEERRSALRRACSKGGKSDSSTLYVMATFAPDGKLSDHSVADDTAPDVAACVQKQLSSLKIPAPGVAVTTRAKFEFP